MAEGVIFITRHDPKEGIVGFLEVAEGNPKKEQGLGEDDVDVE